MGNKSNATKFSSEIPALLAHLCDELPSNFDSVDPKDWINTSRLSNPDEVLAFISIRLTEALEKGRTQFIRNFNQAKSFLNLVERELEKQGLPMISKINWSPTEKNGSGPDDPTDIKWLDHPWLGVSIKTGAPNLYNLGTEAYGFSSDFGQDLFEQLSPEWKVLVKTVKKDLLKVVDDQGHWSKKGKYLIRSVDSNSVSIEKEGIVKWTGSKEDFLENKEPKGHRRVVGDFFQSNKRKYKELGDKLYKSLSTTLVTTHQSAVNKDKKLAAYHAGIASNTYVYMDLGSKTNCYIVPGINDSKIKINSKATNKTFGSGYIVECDILVNDGLATVDSYFRYHTGTLSGPPQNMIQNLRGKQNIWKRIS
jgi:hypothetical protein